VNCALLTPQTHHHEPVCHQIQGNFCRAALLLLLSCSRERGHSRTSSWGCIRTTHASKQFPNGDTYVGEVAAGIPHGRGKYTWKDGSSYDGDWSAGKKHGKGLFHWPTNATYEGDWMGGQMEGWGTYRSPNGESYRGSWHLNQKHGLGKKKYANGDVYDGLWQNGAFEGPGRYIWANGNSYSGNWREGKMDGKGIFVWANRDRYDGEWAKGRENGKGVFTWADGSVFEGSWLDGLRHGRGTYYPPGLTPGGLRSRKGSRTALVPPKEETPPHSGELGEKSSTAEEGAGISTGVGQAPEGTNGGAEGGEVELTESGERTGRVEHTAVVRKRADEETAVQAAGGGRTEELLLEGTEEESLEESGGPGKKLAVPGREATGRADVVLEGTEEAVKYKNAKVTSFSDWNVQKTPLEKASSKNGQSAGIPEEGSPQVKTVISSPPPASHRRSISADGDSFTFRREGPEPAADEGRFLSAASPFGSRNSNLGLTYDSDTTLSESSFGDSQSGASSPMFYSPVVPRSRLANGGALAQRPPMPRSSSGVEEGLVRDLFGPSSGAQNGKSSENEASYTTPEEDSVRRTSSGVKAATAARKSVDATLSRKFRALDVGSDKTARAVMVREYVEGKLVFEEEQGEVPESEVPTPRARRHSKRGSKEVKRPGETIFKGHRSYDLMLNLQTGIR
jgi:hypothetical protein